MSRPTASPSFDLATFLPYLLNRAAEGSSLEFQRTYRDKYKMLRTEWRVLFHLWHYGDLTAKDICTRAGLHKTKVSRAVAALEEKRFITRRQLPQDRRNAVLSLTPQGRAAAQDLTKAAAAFDAELLAGFSQAERTTLRQCLQKLARL